MTQIPEPFPVYIGYDSREDSAYRVCRYSLERHSSIPLDVKPLNHKDLRRDGLFTREWHTRRGFWHDNQDMKPFSTEFAFTRFLVPTLQKQVGWAMFCDLDFLWWGDLADLLQEINDQYAVMVVKHVHAPREKTKMDGVPQTVYLRKNWSSLVLWNCAHPAHKKLLSGDLVNRATGSYLHGFMWLKDSEIGELAPTWNYLVGHTKGVRYPKALHFTHGGPWFKEHENVAFAEAWIEEYYAMLRRLGGMGSM